MIYSSWDIEQNILKLVISGHFFFALLPPKNPKNQNFGKWKNLLEISSFYKCVPKITIMWRTVPEIWVRQTEFFSILGHFLPFYAPSPNDHENQNTWRYYYFTHVYHKWQSYDVWFLRYQAWQTEFFIILDNFLPFYLPNNLKYQNFEKVKKKKKKHLEILLFTHVYHKS